MAKKKWTVMVFMGANNEPNEVDLSMFAERDLREMESVGSGTWMDIVVQIDRKSGPARYHIQKGARKRLPVPLGNGNTGSGEVLRDFIAWAKRPPYQAAHYLLVLWGHAYRLAFGRDGRDAMDFPELAQVLRQVGRVDIVGFDACGMSIVEGAYQLRDVADYLVASQVIVPLPGWPYQRVLQKCSKDQAMTPRDFGSLIVRRFVEFYRGNSVTMTMLDLRHGEEIGRAVAELSLALAQAVSVDFRQQEKLEATLNQCHAANGQPAIDLATFCWMLSTRSFDGPVRAAATTLGDLLINPDRPFVREHARSDLSVAMLHGVNMFAPSVENVRDVNELRQRYFALDLAQDSGWGQLAFALAEPS